MGVLRLLKWTVLAVVAVAALAIGTLYLLTVRSLPDYGDEFAAPGLVAEVEIIRDSRAVPHIFGQTERDVYFALGFVHAQDRLWQMELGRRVASGRLSELAPAWLTALSFEGDPKAFEAALLRIDETARALDIDGAARASLEALSPDARRTLEAYAAGVNAWIDIVNEDALGAGAPELLFLGATVEPWAPEDSIATLKLMSAAVSSPFAAELDRARVAYGLGLERAEDLFPTGVDNAAFDANAPRDPGVLANRDPNPAMAALAERFPFPFGGDAARLGGASNVWAVSGARSATRAPLLAADPHLPLTTPGVWYVARLEFGDGGVIGATLPGAPVVLVGRNEQIAWGFAALYADSGDFYIEEVNSDDPTQYLTPEGWAPFEERTETIALADGRAVEVSLLRTRHGPVLPLDWPALASVTPEGHVLALSWTTLAEDDATIEGALRLMRARSVEAALALRRFFVAPPQVIVVADRREIASMAVGRAPLRRLDSRTRGRLPGAGWLAENDWDGFVAPEALPLERNPASGYVAAANNRPRVGAYPRHLGYDWPAPYRIARLEQLLANRELHTLSGFQAMQSDEASEMARVLLPLIAAPLWDDLENESDARREALERLRDWYGTGEEVQMDALRAEPLIFAAWTRALTRRLIEDDLGEAAVGFEAARPEFLERVYRNPEGVGRRWCDDARTPAVENCRDMARRALDDALAELSAAYGDISAWRWGRAHEAVHRHLVFDATPAINVFFTIRHEAGGGGYTLKRTEFPGSGEEPYRTVNAGGFRAVFDFADLDRSVFAIATGQSGHFLSRHYDDFSPLWRSGGYAPLTLSRREAEAAAVGVTRLVPAEDAAED